MKLFGVNGVIRIYAIVTTLYALELWQILRIRIMANTREPV